MATRFTSLHRLLVAHGYTGRKSTPVIQNRFVVRKIAFSTQTHFELDAENRSAGNGPSPWKLRAAVCLVRLPILEEELSDIEKKYVALKEKLEFENSVYSDWEIEYQRQKQLITDIESGKKNPEDVDFKETNQDLEDNYEATYNKFVASTAVLDPDDADLRNINRRPREPLVFVTKQQLGNDTVWVLPCGDWQERENLRQSAERTLTSHCGSETGAYFISNAPCGFYKYKFPKGARTDTHVGAKLFIYNAFLPRNSSTQATPCFKMENPSVHILDHAWVARDEMRSYLKPKFTAVVEKIFM